MSYGYDDDYCSHPTQDRFDYVDHNHTWDQPRWEPQHCEPRWEHIDHCTPYHPWH